FLLFLNKFKGTVTHGNGGDFFVPVPLSPTAVQSEHGGRSLLGATLAVLSPRRVIRQWRRSLGSVRHFSRGCGREKCELTPGPAATDPLRRGSSVLFHFPRPLICWAYGAR